MPVGKIGPNLAVLDVETTGFRGVPIEIGGVVLDPQRNIVRQPSGKWAVFSQLINPGEEVLASKDYLESMKIHGITPEHIRKFGVTPEVARERFSAWMGQHGVGAATAYNVGFDQPMLEKMGIKAPFTGLDILEEARGVFGYGKARLEDVGAELGLLKGGEKHRALADAILAGRVLGAIQDPMNDIVAAKRLANIGGTTSPSRLAAAWQTGKRFVRRNPVWSTVGAVAMGWGGLKFLQPGAAFSARDDDYNTLEGMRHGGYAQVLRRMNTEFGSGWRGIFTLPEKLRPLLRGSRGVATTAQALEKRFVKSISTIPESERAAVALEAERFVSQIKNENMFKRAIVINPDSIKEMAKATNVKYSTLLKRTIRHERLHQILDEIPGLRSAITKKANIPTERMGKFLERFPGYKNLKADAIIEEYLAYTAEFNKLKLSDNATTAIRQKRASNIRRNRRALNMAGATKEAAMGMSINGMRGGKGHITNKTRKN